STSKMASLEDITIFGEEDDIRLPDVFEKIKAEENLPDVKTATGSDLRDFFRVVASQHDEDRVYSSDIKKIISWFKILKELPLFNEEAPEPLDAGSEKAASEE